MANPIRKPPHDPESARIILDLVNVGLRVTQTGSSWSLPESANDLMSFLEEVAGPSVSSPTSSTSSLTPVPESPSTPSSPLTPVTSSESSDSEEFVEFSESSDDAESPVSIEPSPLGNLSKPRKRRKRLRSGRLLERSKRLRRSDLHESDSPSEDDRVDEAPRKSSNSNPTQINSSQSTSIIPSATGEALEASQADVMRLRGGVWHPDCRRNSQPLDREGHPNAIAVNNVVLPSFAEGAAGIDDSQEEELDNSTQQQVQNVVDPRLLTWIVNKAKKHNLDPRSGTTYIVMFELHSLSITARQQESWADGVIGALDGSLLKPSAKASNISLAHAADMLCQGKARESVLSLLNILSLVNFRLRVESILRGDDRPTKIDVYNNYLAKEGVGKKVSYVTFCRWINYGTTFAELAAAGSIYFLFLIAAGQLKPKFGALTMQDTYVICRALLRPDDGASNLGKLVKDVFIPAISALRRRLSISVTSAIPLEKRILFNLRDDIISCTDLKQSYEHYSCLLHNSWTQPERDWNAWKCFELPQSDKDAPSPNTILITDYFVERLYTAPLYQSPRLDPPGRALSSVVCILTQYDSAHERNKFPCKKDMESRLAWTLERRKSLLLPKACIRPCSVEEFIKKLSNNLKGGFRENGDLYVYYDGDKLGNQVLDIRDRHGVTIALIGSTVPCDLMAGLLTLFQSLFPKLRYTDSSEDHARKFKCCHLNLYNRYSTNGHDAPNDADPFTLQKEGKRPCDANQFTPRFSAEFYEQETRATTLLNGMKPVIEHIAQVMRERFPKENGDLVAFISGLPLDAASPVHPYGGVAVNLNAATIVHLDPKDLNLCLVLALHDCSGGELVLEGPGIIIRLKSGDFVVFPSKKHSHYNLDFKGLRVSFAFSTDIAAKQWIKDNNGWLSNIHMKSSDR
ncbi:hypothetical protein PM082_008467 [Marasmius tenuissimus]|nr:hypothetical protein PM082_008467 [Marasmius tenuissimus]